MIIKIVGNDNYSPIYLIDINNWVKLLILFYLVFYIINVAFKKCKRKDYIMITFVILYSLVGKLSPVKLTIGWNVESLGFAYGIILYNILHKYKNSINNLINEKYFVKCIFLLITSLIFGLLYLKTKPIFFIGDYLIKIVLGILILMLIIQVTGRFKIGNKVSVFLGKISYEIYLSHNVIFMFLDVIVSKFNLSLNSGVYICLSIIFTIILSVIINKLTSLILNKLKKCKLKENKMIISF